MLQSGMEKLKVRYQSWTWPHRMETEAAMNAPWRSLSKERVFFEGSQEVIPSSSMYMKEEAAGAQGRPLLCFALSQELATCPPLHFSQSAGRATCFLVQPGTPGEGTLKRFQIITMLSAAQTHNCFPPLHHSKGTRRDE